MQYTYQQIRASDQWIFDSQKRLVGIRNPKGGHAPLLMLTNDELEAIRALGAEPADVLVSPLQHVTLTAAMSTTVTLSATATRTSYKVRVAWNNNGASADAKLNIFVNAANDVHGLVASQSAKRRDHQMTMGDAVILVSTTPITRLNFSSDVSITSATHQLQVTFGS